METENQKEKQRLAEEKKAEIEWLKQQHQAELTDLKRIPTKYETPPVQAPKSTPPMSEIKDQRFIPEPRPKDSTEQSALQDQLITSCKQGDEKAVKALLQQGAKPDMANTKGEQPLGAAVWGMCTDVVNTLLKEAKGIAPMTWDKCEKHNLEHYQEVFIISRFHPRDYGEWYVLLNKKIESNLFIKNFHLKVANEQYRNDNTSNWDNWKNRVRTLGIDSLERNIFISMQKFGCFLDNEISNIVERTESGYAQFRKQIKQDVETASRLTATKTFSVVF